MRQDTVWDALQHAAEAAGLWPWFDSDGTLVMDLDITDCNALSGGGTMRGMRGMREVYDGHNHNENGNGGPTAEPNQKME